MLKRGLVRSLVLVSFLFYLPCFAQEESVTITTYYPSPYGVYKEMRLHPNTSPSTCDATNEGAMYYDDSSNEPLVCEEITTSTYAWTSMSRSSGPRATAFTAPGTYTFTVPAGVTSLTGKLWGAGGGGGGGYQPAVGPSGYGGGGGGGGQYVEGIINVTPGQDYTVIVGAGGAGGEMSNAAGVNGGQSSFGTIIAGAGKGGGAGSASQCGFGGPGGTGAGGFFRINGDPGRGSIASNNIGLNAGGNSFGGIGAFFYANSGAAPGGAGAGGGPVSAGGSMPMGAGGNGAAGAVIVYY